MAEIKGVHLMSPEERYQYPGEPEVRKKLEWFRDQKLGFFMHWAPACQYGLIESWPLCEDWWTKREITWTDDMEEFRRQYWAANRTFNPIKFRPDHWAAMAASCGFKYLIFTTKHHDGFCMFDTKTTDYRITAPDCPFSTHKYADIAGSLFKAFRDEGLGIAAYFSKPDWHSQDYWSDDFPFPADRNVNYSIRENPERWERFVKMTHDQFREITSNYGKIDVLWLDGGWVRPDNRGQDIRLGEIVKEIRSTTQPDLIVVDRTVGGEYENVMTPENTIPTEPIGVPWESCLTLGDNWSHHYTENYKSARDLVHILIDIVSKGGNLALGIAPQPDGELPAAGLLELRRMGRWLGVHGEGIYGTRIATGAPEGSPGGTPDGIAGGIALQDARFKATRKGNKVYVFSLYDDFAQPPRNIPVEINRGVMDKPVRRVTLLRNGKDVPFTRDTKGIVLKTAETDPFGAEYADCYVLDFGD
jgi:alpha-L-fucosidase